MRTIDEILDKIKQLKGIKKDTDLAKMLNVKPNTLATWRIRKTIPHDVLFRFCEEHQYDMSWLISGELTTKYIEKDGKKILVFSGEPASYKKEEIPSVVAESSADYIEDPELAEIIDILKYDLPEAKKAVLKILKYRKGLKEGIKDLMEIDKPVEDG
ncbi:MAG: helix-turn-helix domain-containing protein [Nitrospirota bacterium]